MSFTKFAKATLLFPATVFSYLTDSLLGSYKRDNEGNIRVHRDQPLTDRGLLGNVLDGIKYVGRGISNFVYNHRQAIATAFWASLALAGAAALTVFLWPAALTAVTTFTIAGLSIAGVVGANVVAQIGAVAALTAVATSVAVYATAAVVNTISAISSFFASRRSRTEENSANNATFTPVVDAPTSNQTMNEALGVKKHATPTPFTQAQSKKEEPPVHTAPILTSAKDAKVTPVVETPVVETPTAKVN